MALGHEKLLENVVSVLSIYCVHYSNLYSGSHRHGHHGHDKVLLAMTPNRDAGQVAYKQIISAPTASNLIPSFQLSLPKHTMCAAQHSGQSPTCHSICMILSCFGNNSKLPSTWRLARWHAASKAELLLLEL